MDQKIKKVAVVGAGVMGSTIAALLTNAGVEVLLLDIVPPGTDAGQDGNDRDRLARMGVEHALKAQPPAFSVPENAELISTGNLEDDLARVGGADWVIECVLEDMEIKRDVLKKIEPFLSPGTIVTTNTSALSVNALAAVLKKDTRANFFGAHFFNPPRYMKLLEIIPGAETRPEALKRTADFAERRLGKVIVYARDTPNFVANRIGTHNVVAIIKEMLKGGYTFEEVDAITGAPMGRPSSGTFRTLDMVGIDTFVQVCGYVSRSLTDPAEKEDFTLPEFVARMVREGLVGDKKGQGFYKRVKSETGTRILSLDLNTFEYVERRPVELPVLQELKAIEDPGARIKALVEGGDRAGVFAWSVLKKLLLYSARQIPEVAADVLSIDRALKWGFNHELGPFETWDAIGVRRSVERMDSEGERIPDNVRQMLDRGDEAFYRRRYGKRQYYDLAAGGYLPVEQGPGTIILPSLKDRKKVIKTNAGASLLDIGEGVACLEFHSRHNALGYDVLDMINYSVDEVNANWQGLVIGSRARDFCVGGNLMLILTEVQNRNWAELDLMVRLLQGACAKIRFSDRPVVAAPFRYTLGAGAEVCLAAARVRAYSETYMGLVEAGVGLVPCGGGCKEMLRRSQAWMPVTTPAAVPALMASPAPPDLMPFVSGIFRMIASGKASTSAAEARQLGFLDASDGVTHNQDRLLYDARKSVFSMVRLGYEPPRSRHDIRVTGRSGFAALTAGLYYLRQGEFISEHDQLVAGKLARTLTGGDLPRDSLVTEDYLLGLERECFLSLCGEPKTQARILAMLRTGRPLRN